MKRLSRRFQKKKFNIDSILADKPQDGSIVPAVKKSEAVQEKFAQAAATAPPSPGTSTTISSFANSCQDRRMRINYCFSRIMNGVDDLLGFLDKNHKKFYEGPQII
ncbi:hypothetical protein CAEBREN_20449 [Caenorhabditis brenneri]|uniref:Uncharacterized protein n=1 Tax=Caenorhabditis brenneri TaxID=135651 RepID=G0P873_CAEBE|nr:hypothetical protein CAEBREN_20449 [Caenorhabditis brenneri]